MANAGVCLQRDDKAELRVSNIRGEYPHFYVSLDNGVAISVDDRALDAAERLAAALLEGVKRVRAFQAQRAAQPVEV